MPGDKLSTPNDLPQGLGQPALRALTAAKLTSLAKLATVSQSHVAHLHGVGPNAIGKLNAALKAAGLAFAADKKK